ncbi:MAG TPA: hypothetical protein VN201_11990, partial [Roseateles sp.]|nr:hypothetical protein [Roseateles sp.]
GGREVFMAVSVTALRRRGLDGVQVGKASPRPSRRRLIGVKTRTDGRQNLMRFKEPARAASEHVGIDHRKENT